MTLSYREIPETRTVEIIFSGHLTREEYDRIAEAMQRFIDSHQPIRLLEVIESFEGFDPSILWPGLKFDARNIRHISHVAVVSDIGWLSPISKAAGALVSTRLRTFDMAHLEDARAWLGQAD